MRTAAHRYKGAVIKREQRTDFLVIKLWSPSGDSRGLSVVFDAVDMPCSGPFHFLHIADYIYDLVITSSSLGSRCVPGLGEGLNMPSPNYHVLCFPLPYRVAPVCV